MKWFVKIRRDGKGHKRMKKTKKSQPDVRSIFTMAVNLLLYQKKNQSRKDETK